MRLDKWNRSSPKTHRHPCISFREACELAGVESLRTLMRHQEDAPKPMITTRARNSGQQNTWYSKPEMVAWINKMKEIGKLK